MSSVDSSLHPTSTAFASLATFSHNWKSIQVPLFFTGSSNTITRYKKCSAGGVVNALHTLRVWRDQGVVGKIGDFRCFVRPDKPSSQIEQRL